MTDQFEVALGAGIYRSADDGAVHFPHRWTPEGVTVEAVFTGAHLLHLAVAGCVLKDVYREAADLLFHYLILLNAKGHQLSDVLNVLKERHK